MKKKKKKQLLMTAFQNVFFPETGHEFQGITMGHFYWSKCVSCTQEQGPKTVTFLFQKASLFCQQEPFKTQSCHMIPLSMKYK